MGFYINSDGAEAIKAYKYSGSDLSFYYKYVLTPMNNALARMLPAWLAPNVITVTGLAVLCSCLSITVLHSPDMLARLPPSLLIGCALSLFIYQTLDNLDGRQARQTGNSSPLGLLCDHGVDAITVSVSSLMMAAVLRVGPTWKMYSLWLAGVVPFTFATWEEYYTGSLVLGYINGPSDGLLLAMIMCLLPVFYGADFWIEPLGPSFVFHRDLEWISELQRHWIVLAMIVASVVPTITLNYLNVSRKRQEEGKNMLVPLKTLGPFIILLLTGWAWLYYSPSKLLQLYPHQVILALGFVFGNCACKLMLAHLCGHRYKFRRFSVIPLVLATLNSMFGVPVDEVLLMYVLLIFAFGCWLHFVVGVSHELTTILGIRVFFVKSKAS